MRPGERDLSGDGVFGFDEHLPVAGDMGVLHDLVDRVDRRAGDARAVDHVVDLLHRVLRGPFLDDLPEFLVVGDAVRDGPEFGLLRESGHSHDLREVLPELVVPRSDHEASVGRPEGVVGIGGFVAVADALGDASLDEVDHVDDLEARHDGIDEGDIDLLPLSRHRARVQCRENADAGRKSRENVAHRGSRTRRLAAGPPGGAHESAHRLRDDVVSRLLAVPSGVAEPGDAPVDDLRIDLFQVFVSEPELFHRSGAEIFEDDVGLLHHLQEHRLPLRVLEVQRDALLVPVQVHVVRALAVLEGPHLSFVGSFFRVFDLDDVRPHVRKHHGAEGPRQNPGQIQHRDVR